jgi:hypothetical protein
MGSKTRGDSEVSVCGKMSERFEVAIVGRSESVSSRAQVSLLLSLILRGSP